MSTNMISMTNRSIKPIKGQPAYLPNQPLLHNIIVSPNETETLVAGTALTFDTTVDVEGSIFVKKAAPTDTICGYIPYNPICTGYYANEVISMTTPNYFIYLTTGEADIPSGSKLSIDENGDVVSLKTGSKLAGIAYGKGGETGSLIVVLTPSPFEDTSAA